jgi:hypothetical protein
MPSPIVSKFLTAARELKGVDKPAIDAAKATAPTKGLDFTPPPAPTIDQLVGGVMKRFDQDANQMISAEEISSVVNPRGKFAFVDKMVVNLITKFDTSKDGLVDKAEWSKAMSAYDKNADGALSRSEIMHSNDAFVALVGVLPHGDPPPGG